MTRQERLKKEATAARKAAATFRRIAAEYRQWGEARWHAEANRLESNASWHDARAQLWETTA